MIRGFFHLVRFFFFRLRISQSFEAGNPGSHSQVTANYEGNTPSEVDLL